MEPIELQILSFALSFIPGIGPFMPFVVRWAPIAFEAIPVAINLVKYGVPVAEAIEQAHPQLQTMMGEFHAWVEHRDPTKADQMDPVKTQRLFAPLFGQSWTQEETDAWMNRATGVLG